MPADTRPPGKTTVAPDVLVTIACMSALSVPGVKCMAPIPGGVNRLFRRGAGDGVRIAIEGNCVYTDLYIVLDHDVNIRETSRNLQQHVTRAIQEMVAMEVGHVNIHIEDINYEDINEA